MNKTYFFNSDAYLKLECERLGGAPFRMSAPDGTISRLIIRDIPNSLYRDAISTYGYPDLDQRCSPPAKVSSNKILKNFIPKAKDDGIISAYIRLGLSQAVEAPTLMPYASRVYIGESVIINLKREWSEIFRSFRGRLRSQLRNGPELKYFHTNDIEIFHKMYTENMIRVGASRNYFFEKDYLEKLCKIEGVDVIIASDTVGPVSGAITVVHGDMIYYHLGATSDRGLSLSPLKHVLAAIAERNANGAYEALVLGGGVGGANDQLMRFKRGFSKETLPVYALKIIIDHNAYAELCGETCLRNFSEGFFPAYRTTS